MVYFIVAAGFFALSIANYVRWHRRRTYLESLRLCPHCTTLIPNVAMVCRQCLRDVPPLPAVTGRKPRPEEWRGPYDPHLLREQRDWD